MTKKKPSKEQLATVEFKIHGTETKVRDLVLVEFHRNWCDLRHCGHECNCDYGEMAERGDN